MKSTLKTQSTVAKSHQKNAGTINMHTPSRLGKDHDVQTFVNKYLIKQPTHQSTARISFSFPRGVG